MRLESDGRVMTTIAEVLGRLPMQGASNGWLDSVSRAAVRTYLTRMGWSGQAVVSLPINDLERAYTSQNDFEVIGRQHGQKIADDLARKARGVATGDYKPRNDQLVARLKAKLSNSGASVIAEPVSSDDEPVHAPLEDDASPAAHVDDVPAFNPSEPVAKPTTGPHGKAEQLAALLASMSDHTLDEKRVIELIREHASKPRDVHHVVTIVGKAAEPVELSDVPRHGAFADVLASVGAGLNVMMVGPAGCGKTHLASQVADALALPFYFTGAVDSPYELTGYQDANGKLVRKPFREAFENGGLFLWDEIDASNNGALLKFNAGLSNGKQDFPDANVTMHESFRAIASANTYGRGADRQYVGRTQLDAASLDRFAVIDIDYDETLERALYGDTKWVTRVHRVRAAVRTLKVRHVVSMRAIDQGARLLKAGMSTAKVEEIALWKGLDPATVAKVKDSA